MSNPEILPEDPNRKEGAPVDPRSEVVRMIEALSAADVASVQPMPELSAEQHAALAAMLKERDIDLETGENGDERYLKSLKELRFRARVDNLSFKGGRSVGFLHALGGEEQAIKAVTWSHEQALLHEWDEEIRGDEDARGRSIQQAMADVILIAMDPDSISRNKAIGRLNQRVLGGWEQEDSLNDGDKASLQNRFERASHTNLNKLRGIPPGSLIDVWYFLTGETSTS